MYKVELYKQNVCEPLNGSAMVWRGFLYESKFVMDYPNCGRWYFWSHVPFAYIKWLWWTFKDLRKADKLRKQIIKYKELVKKEPI